MPVELEMPELAESVIEGEIVKWLVKEGDFVKQDQLIVEVMTDKVTVEVPSPLEGVLLKQVAKEGDVVPIGKPIAIFGKVGETLDAHAAKPEEKPGAKPEAKFTQPAVPRGNGQTQTADAGERALASPFGRPLAAPAVRKLAREMGIDLNHVRGSGDGGRIKREDIVRVAGASTAAGVKPAPAAPAGETERVPLRGLRRAIADHMAHSKHTAAHTLHVDEADLTDLVAMRERAKERAAARGVKLTYLPFFVKASCDALKAHPYMNASLDDAKHEIVLKKEYNIGVATDTDGGLVVPVIHHADRMSIFELARRIAELAEKARQGHLSHDEIAGGTFTITNVGSVGGLFTFPVINYPEVGILGTHSIQQRPVVRDGQVAVRHMMYLSISFDHRVVDGATAARFVRDVIDALQNPDMLLMEGGA